MKKSKLLRALMTAMVLVGLSIPMVGCVDDDLGNGDGGNPPTEQGGVCTVTFKDGDEVIHTASTIEDVFSYQPPAKTGKVFAGWYLDAGLTQPFGETLGISSTLYAKWEDKTYTVRFLDYSGNVIQVNGQNYQTVVHGQSAIAPEDPTQEGFEFKGWTLSFDSVTSDLVVRPIFGNVTQGIYLYGEDNEIIREVRAETDEDISVQYDTLLRLARESVPSGLTFEGLYTDEARTIPYVVDEEEHYMPTHDVHLYTKVVLEGITGLSIVESRNNFKYDLGGVDLSASLYENDGITYTYEWYDVNTATVIDGAVGKDVSIGCKDVGDYVYEIRVTATYKDLEPVVARATKLISVRLGELENLISLEGLQGESQKNVYSTDYNATVRTFDIAGLQEDDVVSYKDEKESEADFVESSPILNAGEYKLSVRVERRNYEPVEYESITVVVNKLELMLTSSLVIAGQQGDPYYSLEYGSTSPTLRYSISGFAQGESERNLILTHDEVLINNNYQAGMPVLEDGEFYEVSVDRNNWTSVNYYFNEDSWVVHKLKIVKRALVINVQPYSITYGDNAPVNGEYSVTFGTGSGNNVTGTPLNEDDERAILDDIKFSCSYKKGDGVSQYPISAYFDETNTYKAIDSYDVTINASNLTVNKKALTITPDKKTVTYGDAVPTYTFKATGLVNGDTLATVVKGSATVPTVICSYAKKSNAGKYTISIDSNSIETPNYNVTLATAELTVNKKKATLTLGSRNITYYDSLPTTEEFNEVLTASGLVAGDDIEDAISDINYYSQTYAKGEPAGEYEVEIRGTHSSNYTLTLIAGKVIVGKKNLVISLKNTNAEIVYGETYVPEITTKDKDGNEQLVGDDVFDHSIAYTVESIDGYTSENGVGVYNVIPVCVSNKYIITCDNSATLTVKPRDITVVIKEKEITYGDETPEFDYELRPYKAGANVFALDEDITTLGNFVVNAPDYKGNAGTYDIVASGYDNANYNVKVDVSTLTVNKKTLYVSPVSVEITYGDQIPAYTFTVQGLANDDSEEDIGTLDAVCGYYYKANVGKYTISVNRDLLQSINYDFELTTAELTVNKKDAIIALDSSVINYYEELPNENELLSKLYAQGLVEGDTIASLRTQNASFDTEYVKGANAGEYEISISGYESSNYNLTLQSGTLTVNKRALSVKVGSGNVVYGNAYEPTLSYNGFVGGDDASVLSGLVVSGYETGNDVGSYVLTASGAEADNYEISYVDGALNVEKRNVNLVLGDKTITYGDETPKFTYALTSYDGESDVFAEGESLETLGTLVVTAIDYAGNAGSYDIVASGLSSDNYAINVTNATLIVKKKAVTVTPDSFTLTYGDDVPKYSFSAEGLIEGETLETLGNAQALCAYERKANVGGYQITIAPTSLANDNYDITLGTGIVTVNKKDAIIALDSSVITYYEDVPNENELLSKLYAQGLVEGDTIASLRTQNASFDTEYVKGANAGEYEISISGYESSNYNLTLQSGTLTVNKRALSVKVGSGNVIYGNAYEPTLSYNGFVGEDDASVLSGLVVSGYETGNDVGSYVLTASGAESDNYEISYVDGALNVEKRNLVIKARDYTDDEIVWNGNVHSTSTNIAFMGDGLYEGDEINGILMTTNKTQGAYVADGDSLGDKFVWDENAPLAITSNGQNKLENYNVTFDIQVAIATYGVFVNTSVLVYDGQEHGLEVTHIFEEPVATVLYSADGVDYSETPITRSQAGTTTVYYAIIVYDAYGEVEKEIKDQLNITISKRNVNLVVDDKTITYGDETPKFTYALTSYDGESDVFAEGESLETLGTLVVTADDYEGNAGSYDIVASGLSSDNYAINVTNATLTVNKKAVTVTPDSFTLTYGDDVPKYSFRAEGLIEGETLETLGNAQAVCAYERKANVGGYQITIAPTSLSNDNYDITLGTGSVTVGKKSATLTLSDVEITYYDAIPDENAFNSALLAQGLVDGDTIASLRTQNASFDTLYAVGSNVGEYEVVVNGYSNNNYDLTVENGTLIVNKRALSIAVNNANVIYGNAYEPTLSYNGFVGEDNEENAISGLVVSGYETGNDVGSYVLTASGAEAVNYEISYVDGALNVEKRNVNLVLGDKTITYGDEAPNFTYTITSYDGESDVFAEGESLETLGTLLVTAGDYEGNAGSYDIVASGLSSDNYAINVTNAILTVNKKAVTVTPDSFTLTYGDEVPVYTFSAEGLVEGETLETLGNAQALCAYERKANVGGYQITIAPTSLANDNYDITLGIGSVTVGKKSATLTLSDVEITYYDAIPDENAFNSVLLAQGLVEGDTIASLRTQNASFDTEYVKGVNAGEYEVVVNGYSNNNYDLNIENGTLIVNKRALSIALQNDYLIYGDEYTPSFRYTGFVGEDNEENAISGLEVLGETKNAGEHSIVGANAISTNYEISYVGAKLEIEQRHIYLVIDAQEKVYGEEDPTFTYSLTSYVEGKPVFGFEETVADLGEMVIAPKNFVGNAGVYDIEANGITNNNYAVNVTTAKFTVSRKDLTITAKDMTITFGDKDPSPYFNGVEVEGFVNGDTIENVGTQVLYSCAFVANANGKAGTYDITPRLSLDNYTVTAKNGTLTVNKKNITVTGDTLEVFYGEQKPTLSAKSNYYAYNDTIDTIGTFELSCQYEKGNDVGTYAIVVSSAQSDKYNITVANGKVVVKPYETAVTWVGNTETYTYDTTDRSDLISATYLDLNGEEHVATVTFSASNSTPNAFINAGTYTVTATTGDGNYKLTGASIKLVMGKASYNDGDVAEHSALGGVYSPQKTLGANYVLETSYNWTNNSLVPTVDVTEYDAYYNADTENYVNYPIKVVVEITPALVSLSSSASTVETSYTIETSINEYATSYTIAPSIYWIEGGKTIGSGLYTLTYSNGTTFTPGSHHTVMTFSSINYKMDSTATTKDGDYNVTPVSYFIKYKSVDVGGTLYTPEDALNTATSGNVIVKANTTFASQQNVIDKFYSSTAYYTVKAGVTLLVPYKEGDTKGYLSGGKSGTANYNEHPSVPTEGPDVVPVLFRTLTIPEIVNLKVNGALTVGALTGVQNGGARQNRISGNYSEIYLYGHILAENSALNIYGYIKGSGKITATGTTEVTENMHLTGFTGGTISGAKFLGDGFIPVGDLTGGKDINVTDSNIFPFNQYELRSIQSTLELNYGTSLRGFIKIATSAQSVSIIKIDAEVHEAFMPIVSSSTDVKSGIIRMTEGAKVTKTFTNDRVKITTDGTINDGYSYIAVPVITTNIVMSSQNVLFPIDGRIDIVVNSGTFNQTYKYKMMPGATLTVKSGATYNMNGTIVTYKNGFTDISVAPYPTNRGDAKVYVEGTFNINGSFGGDIYGINGGKVAVGSSATIADVESKEGTGSMKIEIGYVLNAKVVFTFTESGSQTRNLELHNASGNASVSKGSTYTYNGSTWG